MTRSLMTGFALLLAAAVTSAADTKYFLTGENTTLTFVSKAMASTMAVWKSTGTDSVADGDLGTP